MIFRGRKMFKERRATDKVNVIANVNRNNKRVSKLLVELSIGVIGVIGIMLAQISDGNSNYSALGEHGVKYQIMERSESKGKRVASSSPIVPKIDWLSVLF